MTQYNDEARGALNVETATKAELNNALLNPLSASVLKNTSRADLVAMIETPIPEPAGYSASEKQIEAALPGDATPKQVKAVRVPKPAKARALFMRKPGREAKTYKAGTKRAEIALALLKGATIDDMRAICVKADGKTQWSANAKRAALTTFQVNNGFGIEERDVDGVRRFFLIMPAGMESPVA